MEMQFCLRQMMEICSEQHDPQIHDASLILALVKQWLWQHITLAFGWDAAGNLATAGHVATNKAVTTTVLGE